LGQPKNINVEAVKKTVNTGPKPSFESLISLQLSDGNWSNGAESIILNYFSDGSIQDTTIEDLIAQAKNAGSKEDSKVIHLTIIALYILKEEFPDKKDEW